MKKYLIISTLLLVFVTLSCRSEYEKIRKSNDSEKIYKKAFDLYEQEEYFKAQTLFELIINSYRGKQEAENLFFTYAYTHYHLDQYILAAHYFKSFSETFINSKSREEADYMAAMSNYNMSPNYKLEQENTSKAIDAFQLFVNTYPNSDRLETCNSFIDELRKKLEDKAYYNADLYYNLREYQSAITNFNNILIEFPDTKDAEKIRFMILKSSYEWAKNSIYEKRKERFEETNMISNKFLDRYNKSKYRKEVRKIASNSKKEAKKLKYG